ncbi:sialic acid-binding Ig-like lectin 15 [Lates japonicus]|uniref:Sialic acid-binding Ig-like lectin 15 n=1 Tax=Lates japonicus TaxID=270547 RepID=A0AAD3NAL0_LATJO|nr:sialic acid-binding Ig-like lectin 15 [Lates japonicus]GLD69583.1 sialic acid-binding Ig-like lectin 15 [Lates japonicus]
MVVSPEVTVSRGEDAVLNCSFTHPQQQSYSGTIAVKWARASNSVPFFRCSVRNESMEGPTNCSFPELKHSLHGDPRRGELSLLIREAQLNDNGEYFCGVKLDGRSDYREKKTKLYVKAEPQILSLSVVETPSDSGNTTRRLQCEVEGNALPKVVWLLVSRKMMENQVKTSQTGPYRVTSSVPYSEGEVLTCRVESELGEAERTYPPSNTIQHSKMIAPIICGVLVVLLISAGVIVYCLRKRRAQDDTSPVHGNADVVANHQVRASDSPADAEIQLVYSTVTLTDSNTSPPLHVINSTQQHEEQGVLYSPVRE